MKKIIMGIFVLALTSQAKAVTCSGSATANFGGDVASYSLNINAYGNYGSTLATCESQYHYVAYIAAYNAAYDYSLKHGYSNGSGSASVGGTLNFNGTNYTYTSVWSCTGIADPVCQVVSSSFVAVVSAPTTSPTPVLNANSCQVKYPQYPGAWPVLRAYHLCI